MRYSISEIEDQLIATLKAKWSTTSNEVPPVTTYSINVETHAGDVNPLMFMDMKYLEAFKGRLPFCFIQYLGKAAQARDSAGQVYVHRLRFRLFIGTKNLRDRKEGQRSAYTMLSEVYDEIHGHQPKVASGGFVSSIPSLAGSNIATANFSLQSVFLEAGGEDEKLIVNLPGIVVYQTDYVVSVLA